MIARGVAIVALLIAGCGDPEPAASDAVRGYFTAVAAHDCDALARLSGGKVAANLAREGCDGLLAAYAEMGLALLEIRGETADGRARDARIVRTRLAFSNKDATEAMLRVELHDGRWVLVSL